VGGVDEAGGGSDLFERLVGLHQQLLRARDTALDVPAVRRLARRALKARAKWRCESPVRFATSMSATGRARCASKYSIARRSCHDASLGRARGVLCVDAKRRATIAA